MSWHGLVSAQISNVCITRHAALNAIAYIVCVKQFCDVTSSNFFGVLGQWEQKGEAGWYIHSRVKTAQLCVGLAVKKTLTRVITQMVLETVIHLTGPPSVFKCDLLAG